MGKEKGKVIDMAKKAQPKIEKEELEEIQKLLQGQNWLGGQIGNLEIQKGKYMDAYLEGEDKLSMMKAELEKKYGKMNIDLRDGSLSPVEEKSDTKKPAVKTEKSEPAKADS